MDGIRVGRSLRALRIRALRIRAGKRQADVAGPLGISRQLVSKVETGQIDDVTCGTIERIAAGLGARAEWRINWRGEGLDRLLDGDHAEIVESLARMLRDLGWETAVEVSFNVRGGRGSVDLAALDRPTSTVLIAEIKTVVPDAGPMLFTLDRKARLAPEIAKSLGWPCKTVARALVIGESSTTRRRITSLGATFAAALPKRGREVMRWLKTPTGRWRGCCSFRTPATVALAGVLLAANACAWPAGGLTARDATVGGTWGASPGRSRRAPPSVAHGARARAAPAGRHRAWHMGREPGPDGI